MENGYIRIATELWERLGCFRISGQEWLILNCVIRKTYGWQKKEDHISLSQFQEYTGMRRSNVCRAINKLVSKKILGSTQKGTSTTLYCLNKHYQEWTAKTASPQKETSGSPQKGTRASLQIDNKLVSKKRHTIDIKNTNTKDTIQKIVVPYSKIEDLQDSDLEEIAAKYSVPLAFVKSKCEDMYLWANEKAGRGKGRNWRLTLMNWVKRDALKVVQSHNDKRSYENKYRVTKV